MSAVTRAWVRSGSDVKGVSDCYDKSTVTISLLTGSLAVPTMAGCVAAGIPRMRLVI